MSPAQAAPEIPERAHLICAKAFTGKKKGARRRPDFVHHPLM